MSAKINTSFKMTNRPRLLACVSIRNRPWAAIGPLNMSNKAKQGNVIV